MIIKFEDLKNEFKRILLDRQVREDLAEKSADNFARNDLDGVHTHGSIRFPSFIKSLDKGKIDINALAEKESAYGGYEVWNGNNGIGNINAKIAMDRAIELAKENGIGIVALKNTNHWMRGGTYAWQAADEGLVSISWTNSNSNMPMWGGKDNKLGNNPIVFGVPREDGKHIVVDTALAQFSYGKLEEYRLKGKELPIEGGYNKEGKLTKIPGEIEETKRTLPIGLWKGSSLAFVLDMVGLVLSGGNSTAMIDEIGEGNFRINQVFITIDPSKNLDMNEINKLVDKSIKEMKDADLVDSNRPMRYPGERALATREKQLKEGIEIEDKVWEKLKSL